MEVKFVWPADDELEEAISYYNIQQVGLGDRFFSEVNIVIERIKQFPRAWAKVGPNTRKCLLNKFPHSLKTSFWGKFFLLVSRAESLFGCGSISLYEYFDESKTAI